MRPRLRRTGLRSVRQEDSPSRLHRDLSAQERLWRMGYDEDRRRRMGDDQSLTDDRHHWGRSAVSFGAFVDWLLGRQHHRVIWLFLALAVVLVATVIFTVFHYLWLVLLALLAVVGVRYARRQETTGGLRPKLRARG